MPDNNQRPNPDQQRPGQQPNKAPQRDDQSSPQKKNPSQQDR